MQVKGLTDLVVGDEGREGGGDFPEEDGGNALFKRTTSSLLRLLASPAFRRNESQSSLMKVAACSFACSTSSMPAFRKTDTTSGPIFFFSRSLKKVTIS